MTMIYLFCKKNLISDDFLILSRLNADVFLVFSGDDDAGKQSKKNERETSYEQV